jgi:hypothetical protein
MTPRGKQASIKAVVVLIGSRAVVQSVDDFNFDVLEFL